MPNPIAFYKEIFLHVIPVRITVPWFTLTFSTFFSVSPMCSSSHKHLPLFITQEGCGFLLLTVNCDFTFCKPITGQCLEFLNRFFGSIFVFFTVCISTKIHSYTRTSNILPSFNVLIFFCQFEPQVFLFRLLFIHVLINCNFYTWQLLHTWPVEKAGSFPFHKRQKEILKEFP